jgi:hypothetical protein
MKSTKILPPLSDEIWSWSDEIYKNSPPPPRSDVNLKTGQDVEDDILPCSLQSTLFLHESGHAVMHGKVVRKV